MSRTSVLEKTMKSKHIIENYIDVWERVSPEKDPLLSSWRRYIEENKKSCRKEQ